MNKISLSGDWKFRQTGTTNWLPATVPGGAHTDLLALKMIPDPFVGDNEKKVAWVAKAEWEYSRSFVIDPELLHNDEVWLVCDGLDTFAAVSVNGQLLGKTTNMFRQYRWNVKDLLNASENTIEINFASTVNYAAEMQAKRALAGVPQAIVGGPYVRKAPCHFGWDWGPQLPPVGIWKDIRIEAYSIARIKDIHIRQDHQTDGVHLSAEILVDGPVTQLTAKCQLTDPDGTQFQKTITLEETNTASIIIPNPQLWWPNGLGNQSLYQLVITLMHGDDSLDAKEYHVGLRTIELRQQPDDWGRSFTFVVNGHPIFAKGSDWIPADSFPTRISDEYLEGLIRSAAQTHQNMLRVWGGGFYEEERFYDLCDKYGILVWQDFIFSCSIYPLFDQEFLANVKEEVEQNVRRIRHRASLALWCGNNEMEQGWAEWGWKGAELDDLRQAYDQFFHHTLADWCNAADPDNYYWPSSPSSDTPFDNPNGQIQGDAHYWDVWHGRKPFTAYRNQFPRFMSEFGFQALPPMDTIRTFAEEKDWNMTSYIMEQHQKNASGNSLMVGQMLDTFRLPKDFESLVYLSMVLQAEGIRYGVEHWRRHTNRVSGTLYWQLNDCWPVASWSSLDYFGRWKALHYAAKRFYAPLLLSIEDAPPKQSIYLSSDLLASWKGILKWSLTDQAGEVLKTGEQTAHIEPSTVICIDTLDFSEILTDENSRELVFVAELFEGSKRITMQTAFFAPTKHLNLVDPTITSKITLDQNEVQVDLRSDSLARLVECSIIGVDVVFSDNYFDLPANNNVHITFPLPVGWSIEMVKENFRVRSIYNTYSFGTK